MRIQEILAEAHINQQVSRYHPDTKTYRSQPLPDYDKNDIMSRGQKVDALTHQDMAANADEENPAERNLDLEKARAMIQAGMSELPKRYQMILKLRFWNGESLAEIGERFGISVERVRQIESKAFRLLKSPKRLTDPNPDARVVRRQQVNPEPTTQHRYGAPAANPRVPRGPRKTVVTAHDQGYADGKMGRMPEPDFIDRNADGWWFTNPEYEQGYRAGRKAR